MPLVNNDLQIVRDALQAHVEALAVDIGPRTPFTANSLERAATYIQSILVDAGYAVTEQPYQYLDCRVANVIGSSPVAAEASDFFLVGAHYDTVQTTPGADDNASAVAVMLELARRVSGAKLKVPVLFVAFTLEEPPAHLTRHQGSRVFVRQGRKSGNRTRGAIILEMVGYTAPRQHYPFISRWPSYPTEGNFIGIIGNWRSRRFGHTVLRGFHNDARLPVESLFVPFNGWILPATRLSDHASFWDAGWPALMVTDTAFFRNPNYHLPSDTIDTLDFDFMAELVVSLELRCASCQQLQSNGKIGVLPSFKKISFGRGSIVDQYSDFEGLRCRIIDAEEARTTTHREVLLILAQTFDEEECRPQVKGG